MIKKSLFGFLVANNSEIFIDCDSQRIDLSDIEEFYSINHSPDSVVFSILLNPIQVKLINCFFERNKIIYYSEDRIDENWIYRLDSIGLILDLLVNKKMTDEDCKFTLTNQEHLYYQYVEQCERIKNSSDNSENPFDW